ncbi:hypothetical protein OTBS_1611 [Orientia tsutsugamushi str. Boryong]|uniref:Uncharacterized protein n=1 Tax=Orientia tsutsugamushi (strain Boryong) TaxID=357244 RepID=A5CER1_ORITB|nr:hypothetical protein OTBS_1611 [Orientia tsutsugamushi str. Boryong]
MLEHIGFHYISLSGLSRSPFGFGSNVSLSTLYYCRYLQQHKTRYMVDLASPSITGLSPVRLIHLFLTHRPNLLRLFRYLSAIILNCFSIPITVSFTTLSPANLGLFFLSFLVKGFFLLFFFGNSELL